MSRHRNQITALVLALLGIGVSTLEARELSILLTNDDGYDAPGLTALHEALTAAGYRVVVVAPRTDQSGSSAKISTAPVAYKEETPGIWAIDGSPADAAAIGLAVIMKESPPDLVVSGANRGQNLGTTTNLSGTVGAAVMATMRGVPAIAVSVGLNFDEAKAGFPTTIAAYPGAAKFVSELVAQLSTAAGDGPLLPPRILLNVNYPARAQTEILGAEWTTVGSSPGYRVDYVDGPDPGTIKLAFGPDPATAPSGDHSDTVRFAAGHITVSVLDGDWSAAADRASEVASRVGAVVKSP